MNIELEKEEWELLVKVCGHLSNLAQKTSQQIEQKQKEVIEERREAEKKKVTFYLTEEEFRKFDQIHGKRIIEGNKLDRSDLICEMIRQYEEEN